MDNPLTNATQSIAHLEHRLVCWKLSFCVKGGNNINTTQYFVFVLIEGGNNIPLHNTTQYLVHQQTDTKCISGFVNSIQVSFYVLFNLGNLISFYFSLIFGQSRLQPWAIGIPWRLPCLDFLLFLENNQFRF